MGLENKIMSRTVNDYLYGTGFTLATAESCTGGRIAEAVIATPGSSDYFKGGIICYTDEIKERLVGVSRELLEEKTAVSEEVAKAMVQGVISTMHTDFAVASTGYAGPGGGTPEAPVGTIWIACGDKDHVVTQKLDSRLRARHQFGHRNEQGDANVSCFFERKVKKVKNSDE